MISSSYALAAAAFNLACSGTQIIGTYAPRSARETPFNETYRVDLDRMRWCSGTCDETRPLAKVTETQIYFEHVNQPPSVDLIDVHVNRESGAYEELTVIGTGFQSRTGHCKRLPFTGFPAKRF